MAEPLYPPQFPPPQRDSYGYVVDMGVVRTPMESGGPRQRRRYVSQPHYFSLEFVIPRADLVGWQLWATSNAYDWFRLPLVNWITAGDPLCSNYCVVRFTSDLGISAVTGDYLTITVAAELKPGQNNDSAARTRWIIGGTPTQASPDWVIGGTPSLPSPDFTVPI